MVDLLKKLNKQQKQAVEYADGPLLIVAGAGTGKTTVITRKITHLIESGKAKPEEILALTFTDKAAGEMEERVDKMLETGYVDLQISTFHAFCQRLLEEYGIELGLSPHFRLLSQTDAWLLMRENIYEFNLDYYRPLGNPTGQIHALLDHFSKCKDELVTRQEYLDYVERLQLDTDSEIKNKKLVISNWKLKKNNEKKPIINYNLPITDDIDIKKYQEIANAYHKYNQLLLDNDSLDFGDLIFYSVKLLKERPNILKKLKERFKFILIDEFQDVNYAQYGLIQLLAGDKSQLTVVGDDDQSIYSFRGSNVSIILRFKEDYPDAKEIVLTENYRSGQEILDFAYKSIQNNNPERLETKLDIDKKLKSMGRRMSDSGQVEHLHYKSLDEEVQGVVQKISKLKNNDKEATYDDFAILVRANSHAEPFLNALETSGIPHEYLASSGLYRQPVVLDAVNFLNVIEHIHNNQALYRLLRLPFLDFEENDLQKLTASAKKKSISYYEALKRAKEFYLSAQGIEIIDNLVKWIHSGMKNARFEKPTAVLCQFMEDSGYFKYLIHEENQRNREVIRQIYHLKQLFDLINNYEASVPGAHVAGFVEHYNYIIESGDGGKMYQPADTPDSVNIITVHGAKGLEYKYVFVVNCVEERFPVRNRGNGIDIPDELVKEGLPGNKDFHYQEERRLFYVAITRAKEKLFLTSANDYGGARSKKISRFLNELGFADKHKDQKIERLKDYKTIKRYNKRTIEQGGKGQFEYTPPTKFSYSQLNSYQRCPYQYKLAHVLKISMKGSAAFSFGNTIHNTLQKFYERVKELNSVRQGSLFGLPTETFEIKGVVKVPEFEELLDLYENSWIPDWYKSKKQRESYYEKGKEILKVFYASQEDNWAIPVSLEGFFKIKIGDYIINGRIDRIDQLEDKTLEIIDYKTGKGKDKLATDDKQQLLIYQLAVRTLPQYKNIGEVGKLTFYYLNDNIKTSFVGKDKDIEKLQEKLLNTIEKIHSGEFKATPGKHICKYCDYNGICEFRQL